MPESPEEFYSRGAEKFAESNSIENLPEEFVSFIDKFIEEAGSGKVLDAGCGPGRDVEYFIENDLEAIGIDLAEGMIEHARENRKGEYRLMDVKDLDFEDNRFEGVYCNTVLHFFPPEEMIEVISELKRVLKPEGVLFVSFKLGEEDYILREKYGSEVKQYLLTDSQIQEILDSQNLEIIQKLDTETQGGFEVTDIICEEAQ